MTTAIKDEDLHAFIDGELDDLSRARMETTIGSDPALSEQIARYRADKERLLSLYGGGLNEPLPREWIRTIENTGARRHWNTLTWSYVAMAATVVLALAGSIAYREFATPARDDIVADALAARAETLPAETKVDIRSSNDANLQAAVLTRALATHVKAPDLTKLGFQLVGMDIYDTPVRSFDLRYRDGAGRIVTLYLRRSSGAPRFDVLEEKGLRICVWQDDVMGSVVTGKVSAAEMLRLATAAYNGLVSS